LHSTALPMELESTSKIISFMPTLNMTACGSKFFNEADIRVRVRVTDLRSILCSKKSKGVNRFQRRSMCSIPFSTVSKHPVLGVYNLHWSDYDKITTLGVFST
jgi:hypothetical protein